MLDTLTNQGNASQSTLRFHFTPVKWLRSTAQVRAHTDEDGKQGKPFSIAGGNTNLTTTTEIKT